MKESGEAPLLLLEKSGVRQGQTKKLRYVSVKATLVRSYIALKMEPPQLILVHSLSSIRAVSVTVQSELELCCIHCNSPVRF